MSSTRTRKNAASKADRLMDEASAALAGTRYFDCERLCREALARAHHAGDYERMSRILMPLQEARRQRRMAAVDAGRLERLESTPGERKKLQPGCYLIEPPLVGADGRDLRDRLFRHEVPALVIVREPKTRLGEWPIVMVGPVTVRTRIPPPKKEKPTVEWMLGAAEALGDEGIAQTASARDCFERVEMLLERLDTVIDHEKLHQRLEEACRETAAAAARGELSRRSDAKSRLMRALAEADEAEEEQEEAGADGGSE